MFPKGCRMNILIPFGLCCLACSGCATPEPHNDKITTLEPHTDKIMRVYFYQNDEPQIGEYRSCGADNGPMLLLNCTSRGSVVPTTSLKAFEQGLSNRNGVPLTLPVRFIGTPLYWSDKSPLWTEQPKPGDLSVWNCQRTNDIDAVLVCHNPLSR